MWVIKINFADAWVYKLFYDIFIKGPALLLDGAGGAISWLSQENLITKIFGENKKTISPPPLYIVFSSFALALFLIIACITIINSWNAQRAKSTLLTIGKNFFVFLIILLLIPTLFWCLNYFTGLLFNIIFHGKIESSFNFATTLVNIGWIDEQSHSSFDYHNYPNFEKYSMFVGSITILSTLVMFFFLTFALIKRIFTIFIYYVQVPFILAKCASTNNWTSLIKWKEDLLAAFLSSFIVILSVILFSQLSTKMINLINLTKLSWPVKIFLKISIIVGGAFSVYELSHVTTQYIEGSYNFHSANSGRIFNNTKMFSKKGMKFGKFVKRKAFNNNLFNPMYENSNSHSFFSNISSIIGASTTKKIISKLASKIPRKKTGNNG